MVEEQYKLYNLGKIHCFFTSGNTIKININENKILLLVTHIDDFQNHFSEVDLLPQLHLTLL